MKIHGLCVVKNEADIIEQTLRSAAKWCDCIYVLDNGSSDGTWEKVQALALELSCITPFMQDSRPFDDGIRGNILSRYATHASRGDWWCILDADEFYIDDPRAFLEQVPGTYNAVWMELYVYHFTDRDLAAYRQNPAQYDDRVPIEQRLRYYVNGDYSELRFFRHSGSLRHVPGNRLHPIYPRRIRLKHFAYRSPDQIRMRLETRREPMQRGEFLHEKRANWVFGGRIVPGPARPEDLPQSWEERVKLSSRCHYDGQDGIYADTNSAWKPPAAPAWTEPLSSRARSFLRRVRYGWARGRITDPSSSRRIAP